MVLGGSDSPCSDLDSKPAKQGLPVLPVNQKIWFIPFKPAQGSTCQNFESSFFCSVISSSFWGLHMNSVIFYAICLYILYALSSSCTVWPSKQLKLPVSNPQWQDFSGPMTVYTHGWYFESVLFLVLVLLFAGRLFSPGTWSRSQQTTAPSCTFAASFVCPSLDTRRNRLTRFLTNGLINKWRESQRSRQRNRQSARLTDPSVVSVKSPTR